MIGIDEAVNVIRQKDKRGDYQPFSIIFYHYDRTKEKGGDLKKIEKAVFKPRKQDVENNIYNILDMNKNKYYPVHDWLIAQVNGKEVRI